MKNNKKKQLPLLLLALLLITTAAYGTKAYFTDTAKQEADIKLTLGNLSIAQEDSEWTYDTLEGLADNATKNTNYTTDAAGNVTFNTVQPGDTFTRTFKFKNDGTLQQYVKLNNALSDNIDLNSDGSITVKNNPFNITMTTKDSKGTVLNHNEEGIILSKEDSISIDVAISVSENTGNTYNNLNDYTLDLLQEVIEVQAIQSNAGSELAAEFPAN